MIIVLSVIFTQWDKLIVVGETFPPTNNQFNLDTDRLVQPRSCWGISFLFFLVKII